MTWRVKHLAQGLGSEVIDEQENEAQPSDDEGGGAQIRFLIADHDSAHDKRGIDADPAKMRCVVIVAGCGADLCGMLWEGRTVAVGAVRLAVSGLRAGGREIQSFGSLVGTSVLC